MYKIKKIDNKKVYYSTKIPVEHFFTTRELIIKDNIDLIKKYLNIDYLVSPNQTHSANIAVFDENIDSYIETDALILNKENVAIYLNFADCTPVILYDKKNNIAAIAHAGWRGTAQKIAPKTFLKMNELFNSNPKDTTALIGPCISFEHFETSVEVILELKKTVNNPQGLFKNNYADLKSINKKQLEEVGISEFDVIPFCTIKDNDKFFSYRKENKTPLRHSALICLKKEKL